MTMIAYCYQKRSTYVIRKRRSANSVSAPWSLALDQERGLYISDAANNRVLYYPSWGNTTASKVFGQLGNFSSGSANIGSTAPSAVSLYLPWGVVSDEDGGLYISDYFNNRVLLFTNSSGSTAVAGTTGATGELSTATTIPTTAASSSAGATSTPTGLSTGVVTDAPTGAQATAAPSATLTPTGTSTSAISSSSAGASSTTSTSAAGEASGVSSSANNGTLYLTIALAAGGAMLVFCVASAFLVYRRRRRSGIPEDWSDISEGEVDLPDVGGSNQASAASEATQYKNLLRVAVEKQIGEGNFGKVFLAKHQGKAVAVKQVMGGEAEDEFMKELEVMLKLSSDRVIELFGVCALPDHGGGLGLVMEFAALGELGDHLRDPARQKELDPLALLQISQHIAEGLAYLHRKNILHRDLAARNVLVVADGSCKLADFGLARVVAEGETYVTQSALPIRWTAPEVLAHHTVTRPSDCYSLGITMWEVFALGRMPFGDLTSNMLVATAVIQEHKRPEKPERCPPEVFGVMESLWAAKPEDRVTAAEAASQLDGFVREAMTAAADASESQYQTFLARP